ncbi:MAG: hypothetical protein ACO25B_07480 [Chitinophagaceae bacterium]
MMTKAVIENYFSVEKKEGRSWISIGILAAITGLIYFFLLGTEFYRGAAGPLFIAGGWLVFTGYRVLQRADKERIRNIFAFDMNPDQLKNLELPLVKKRLRYLVILGGAAIFFLFSGAALYLYYIRDFSGDRWRGMGLALAAMALIFLMLVSFAWKRGNNYMRILEKWAV